ncbi:MULTISPECIES: IS5/IS1182 family transposase [unclassified Nocardiopsis]|uniref:IS5/IS1182 family transposase n=1 Tax=unclassified Nocardiopsis TaxID=2649073 RepID=UPI00093C1DCE|nr:IS5/IS1182 family transposase [Nocardiopsis sp. TSRI0078]
MGRDRAAVSGGEVDGQDADTSMLQAMLSEIRVAGTRSRPRSRPDRVLVDGGYPSKADHAWLRERGIAATIPQRDDQVAHRHKKPGRTIGFGGDQRARYRGRDIVERCFNKLRQWRGIAMRSDKTARNHHAGLCLAAALLWGWFTPVTGYGRLSRWLDSLSLWSSACPS